MNIEKFLVPENKKLKLSDHKTDFTGDYTDKKQAEKDLEKNIEKLSELQDVLYARQSPRAVDNFAGDGRGGQRRRDQARYVGLNPQGVHVSSFKQPSPEELDHDYLWRTMKQLPERGRIGIFNRSYYEDVLIVRVHPEILNFTQLPDKTKKDKNIWKDRFEQIRNFENYLSENGIHVLKFFLHVSKDEQKERFLARINTPEKNWKFSAADAKERKFWDEYMNAYHDAIENTSTKNAPWYVIPADNKWFTRLAISEIIIKKMKSLDLQYPKVSEEHLKSLQEAKALLEAEK